MALANAQHAPGSSDINAEFSARNIKQTLKDYKALKGATGDYLFGAITARHFNLDPGELKAWQDECSAYPLDVQNEIKRTIVYALNTTDDSGNDAPIPIVFSWSNGSSRGVTTTYIPYGQQNGPSFEINISGYPAPLLPSLAERRAKRKNK